MPLLHGYNRLVRLTRADYADGRGEVKQGPLAMKIAADVFDQNGNIYDPKGLSDLFVSWGQFVDHDLSLTTDTSGERLSLPGSVAPVERSIYDPRTGVNGPREQINEITSSIDGSQVYGSTNGRTNALREFSGGRLKMDHDIVAGEDMLIYANAGQLMAGNGDPKTKLFLAGDIRANENTGLTTLHTLFNREHNYWADRISQEHRSWSDEQVFQAARSIVEAEIQKITYQDWLPKLIGNAVGPDHGYNSRADGRISTEFSTAAFRFGHTMVSTEIKRLEEDGSTSSFGNLKVRDAFFNPTALTQTGIDELLRGLSGSRAQALDTKVIDDLNFLLRLPNGITGFSLPAINIARGRDHGLPSYLETRATLIGDVGTWLANSTDFSIITSNRVLQAELKQAYGTVGQVDLWVGGLAEDKIGATQMGVTFTHIIADQFARTRAADRTFGDLYAGLGDDIKNEIAETSLSDIIMRNSNVSYIQEDVFQTANRIAGDNGSNNIYGNNEDNIIIGFGGNDRLYGRYGDDAMFGGDGSDYMRGDGGSDYMRGGAHSDQLYGDDQDDKLFGDDGDDRLYGGNGNDQMFGGADNDTLYGGSGNDKMDGGSGRDHLDGSYGNDQMFGGADDDYMHAGNGRDTLDGGSGNDRMYGARDDDLMNGGTGADVMYGGYGNDIMNGGEQADAIYGESGNDTINGGAGDDYLRGGWGNDVFVFERGSGRDVIEDFSFFSDKIDVSDFGVRNMWEMYSHIRQTWTGELVVDFGQDEMVVDNWYFAQFTSHNFIFA